MPIIDLRLQARPAATVPTPQHPHPGAGHPARAAGTLTLGLVADRVFEVTPFRRDQIEAAPDIGVRWHSDYIAGVVRRDGGFVVLDRPRPAVLDRKEMPSPGSRHTGAGGMTDAPCPCACSTSSRQRRRTIGSEPARNFQQLAELHLRLQRHQDAADQATMLEGRLRRRLRATGLAHLRRLLRLPVREDGLESEAIHLIDAVTTNKTDFFREPSHFDYPGRHVPLPALAGRRPARIRRSGAPPARPVPSPTRWPWCWTTSRADTAAIDYSHPRHRSLHRCAGDSAARHLSRRHDRSRCRRTCAAHM